MPVILAILGAIGTGLTYWFIFGNGQEVLAQWMRDRRDDKRRAAARQIQAAAPMKAITDPRDAAIALMVCIASLRGDLTPEQEVVIKKHIAETLNLGGELEKRFTIARFAASQAPPSSDSIEAVKALLQTSVGPAERQQLGVMLTDVAKIHGGPSEAQERFIENAIRAATPPS
jgi:hypothetical protein